MNHYRETGTRHWSQSLICHYLTEIHDFSNINFILIISIWPEFFRCQFHPTKVVVVSRLLIFEWLRMFDPTINLETEFIPRHESDSFCSVIPFRVQCFLEGLCPELGFHLVDFNPSAIARSQHLAHAVGVRPLSLLIWHPLGTLTAVVSERIQGVSPGNCDHDLW